MRRILCFLMILIILALENSVVWSENTEICLFVSPDGSNNSIGNISSPLADLEGAKNKIRKLRENGNSGHVTVFFREGEYRFDDTVYFESQDSDVTYCAFDNEVPVFTGGFRISADKFEDVILDNGTAVKKINIKNALMDILGVNELDESYYYTLIKDSYGSTTNNYSGRLIYSVDNLPALWPARYPNKKPGFYEDNPHSNFLKTGDVSIDPISGKYRFECTDENILKYAGYDDVWYFGFPEYLFYHEEKRVNITRNDISDGTVNFISNSPVMENTSYFIFNILDELDMPGEYYISRNGEFYLYPNGDFNYLNVSYLMSEFMIKTNSASNVTFKGITFENTRRNGIYVYGGENILIEDCSFYNIGETAVLIGKSAGEIGYYTAFANYEWNDWFKPNGVQMSQSEAAYEQYRRWTADPKYQVSERGRNNGIRNCIIKNTGQSGINISGGNVYTDEECGHFVDNCDISFVGINKRTYSGGITLDNCFGVSVTNNEISHVPATALNGYVVKGLIENNEIYDGLSESNDMGLIYLNYLCYALDLKINNNYLHDVAPEHDLTSASSEPSQRSAIALDNNYGSGVSITNNIIRNIPRGTWLYPMLKLENNVFIDCYDPVYTRDANRFVSWKKSAGHDFFDYEANKTLLGQTYQYIIALPIFIEGETGDFFRTLWQEKYPDTIMWFDILQNADHKGKMYGKYKNNLFVNSNKYWWNLHINLGNVQIASEEELDGLYVPVCENNSYRTDTKCFVDYDNGNFAFTYSAELKYGLESIDVSLIGRK